jgi:hypothetical protein
LPQALPRPPPLPSPRSGRHGFLTNIEASVRSVSWTDKREPAIAAGALIDRLLGRALEILARTGKISDASGAAGDKYAARRAAAAALRSTSRRATGAPESPCRPTTRMSLSGRRGEFHPPAPSDPGVTVSRHPALVVLVTRVWPSMPSGQRAAAVGE